jgi:hypothetical protein
VITVIGAKAPGEKKATVCGFFIAAEGLATQSLFIWPVQRKLRAQQQMRLQRVQQQMRLQQARQVRRKRQQQVPVRALVPEQMLQEVREERRE